MTTWGLVLVTGTVIGFLGASLGFGGGLPIGMAMLPVALLLMTIGIVGNAVATPGLHQAVLLLAGVVAVCAIGMIVVGAVSAIATEPLRDTAESLLRPMFAALIAAVVVFAVGGVVLGGLPIIPAIVVAVGACLLGWGGLVDQERIADIGFWTSTAGWIGLGLMSWGNN
jgi:hypothetical protein